MPDDIALSDADFDDGRPLNATRAQQPWGDRPHGPVFTTQKLVGDPVVRAWCYSCRGWVGPDRAGDPNSLRLVEDDACDHYHRQGLRCSTCERCLPDGALRRGR